MQAMHEGSSSGNAASGLWKAAVWAVALGAAGAASWYVFGPPGTRSATPSVEDATDAEDDSGEATEQRDVQRLRETGYIGFSRPAQPSEATAPTPTEGH
jgi:hypothetical protein